MRGQKRNVFSTVRTLHPSRSMFDLSYEKKFTCDMGQLIPVACDEVVPGDFIQLGSQSLIRFQPTVAPFMHEVNVYTHTFFIPYRILWNAQTREDLTETGDWETFITGGQDGDQVLTIPTWVPTTYDSGSLWDFLGFPVDIDPDGCYPIDFPRRAYNLVYNTYYRDENLQTEVAWDNEDILNRNWEKDYFTSALLEQQRGTAPALPISGTTTAVWPDGDFAVATPNAQGFNSTPGTKTYFGSDATIVANAKLFFADNTVDLSTASTFDIADLRLAFQIQKWLERNNRAGVRYTEFLHAHFGVSPRDDRLQRPEYIGGSKSPVIVSEVLKTSSTDGTSPQGNLAGHGIAVNDSYNGKIHVQEFGLIMTILSVMPRSAYQQGINRQWLRETRFDFYFPEFANLSEQAIINGEIFCTDGDATTNRTIFGYQGRYDEMRTKQNMVVSEMRDTFDYWHIGRQFAAVPTLNSTFVECIPDKRIFADQADPGLIINHANIIKAFRPLPYMAEPGLIDHN